MTQLEIAAVYVAANLLILLWLAVRVISRRFKGRISQGDGGSEELATAIRVHGNASEYIAAGMGGLVVLALLNAASWQIHLLGAAFTVGRVLHAIGMARGPLVFRQVGMVLTLLTYAGLPLALLVAAFT
ncbi:MAG: MAPEG family protein [Pseudomonadota bacterium]